MITNYNNPKQNEYLDEDLSHPLNKLKDDCIYEGDCLEFMKMLPDKYIDCVITDPPYNEVDMSWDKEPIDWIRFFEVINKVMKDNASLYIFGKQPMLNNVLNFSKELFEFRFELIWFKNAPAPHSSNFQPLKQHENIFCFTKKNIKISDGMIFNIESVKTQGQGYRKLVRSKVQKHRGFKDFLCINEGRFPISVIYAEAIRGGHKEYTGHNTQKPLSLIRWIISLASNKGNLIFDPFAGSGTTLIASKELNRIPLGCEINPEYVNIIRKRLTQTSVGDFNPLNEESLISVKRESADSLNPPHDLSMVKEEANFS